MKCDFLTQYDFTLPSLLWETSKTWMCDMNQGANVMISVHFMDLVSKLNF